MLLIPIVPPFLITHWDNYQLIIFATIPLVGFGWLSFLHTTTNIYFLPSDLAWAIFIGTGFGSYFWAVNGSLIWNPAICWLTLFLWTLLFRSLAKQQDFDTYLSHLFIGLGILAIASIMLSLVYREFGGQQGLGYHRNYLSSYSLIFYPFLLFYKGTHPFWRGLKIVSTCLILGLIYVTNSRGVGIAFIVVGLLYLWTNRTKKQFMAGLSLIGIFLVFLIGGYQFQSAKLTELPLLGEFDNANELDRWYMVRNSFWLFLEHPIRGIGLGNWHLEAYKYGVAEFADMNNPEKLLRLSNHNLYSQHFAELGLMGGLPFIMVFVSVLWKSWRQIHTLSPLQKGAFAAVLVYLFSIFFYASPNFHPNYFSGLAVVAFCSLGILSSQIGTNFKLPLWAKRSLFFAVILSIAWYSYSKKMFEEAQFALRLEENYAPMSIKVIESIYHPIFFTTFRGRNSLALELATLYQQQEKYEKAEHYYKQALALAPYDEKVLIHYSEFLLKYKKDFTLAKSYIEQLYQIQPNHFYINYLMAKVAEREGNRVLSEQYLFIYDYYKKD